MRNSELMVAKQSFAFIIECECLTRHIGEANTSYAVGILHSEATSFAHSANFIVWKFLSRKPSPDWQGNNYQSRNTAWISFTHNRWKLSGGHRDPPLQNRAKRNGSGCPAHHIGKANTSYAAGILHSETTSFAHSANFIAWRNFHANTACRKSHRQSMTIANRNFLNYTMIKDRGTVCRKLPRFC